MKGRAKGTGMVNLTDSTQLPRELMAKVEAQLEPGESIVWLGQPVPGGLVKRAFWGAIMGIPLAGFGLLWLAVARLAHSPHLKHVEKFLPLPGWLFFLIGVAVLLSPLRMFGKARQIVYSITNRRALIMDASGGTLRMRSYTSEALRDVKRVDGGGGVGDLIMERSVRRHAQKGRFVSEHGFLAVPDVKTVEALVMKLAAA